ncbi:MAG: response regulator transcription factor [Acidimicrobiales bacterium]|jgi:DNA-binding NarL/FixJ family response regulator|nr:response regulator transcription factor [Acidimicrobiales bacterium]
MTRVVVVDDQVLVRDAFALLLRTVPDFEVVGVAGDGAEAVEVVERTRPDVVVMDIRMPVMDGLEATHRILAGPAATTRVLILTTFGADEYVFEAIRAGASGFLLKDAQPATLVEAVRTVARGDALLAPHATRRLIEAYLAAGVAPPASSALKALTEREVEVLRAVASGASNNEIAADLHISYATVKSHVAHLLDKLGARDRIQLVVLAYENGVVRPGGCPQGLQ